MSARVWAFKRLALPLRLSGRQQRSALSSAFASLVAAKSALATACFSAAVAFCHKKNMPKAMATISIKPTTAGNSSESRLARSLSRLASRKAPSCSLRRLPSAQACALFQLFALQQQGLVS